MAERNYTLRESAFSSSIGESIGLSFSLKFWYPELSQVGEFEVLADAKNLTYWRTSTSPLMCNLRATVAGLYDLSRVKIINIARTKMFSDSIARLSTIVVDDDHDDLGSSDLSAYTFRASDVLCPNPAEAVFASNADYEGGFHPSCFTEKELAMMKKSTQTYTVHANRPVTRKIGNNVLFMVPEAKVQELITANHVDIASGTHLSQVATRARLAHFHWSKKLQSIHSALRLCTCAEARGHKGLVPLKIYTGQASRPNAFGQVVYFDQKSYMTHEGRQYLGTALDKTTGLFRAILIEGLPERRQETRFSIF
jgi:hypothetical protein